MGTGAETVGSPGTVSHRQLVTVIKNLILFSVLSYILDREDMVS
jgi:hypothetical protein